MNVKYYYEFKGHDNILNRVEILTAKTAVAQEVTVSYTPIVLEYSQVKKLDQIFGSGVTLSLISEAIFQFEDLHTDNMQEYLVKFYRNGVLYWLGWLDPELYEENLSLYPPYPVEFTAADFNVLERLKFTDSSDKSYTDIVPFITQLKRCFDKLNIPFIKLYIGCTTVADGIVLSSSETILHKLYIQSINFYDEDNKPMSCKEVIESILAPFALVMIQRDASVYIYDYNTIMLGLEMKVYDFSTLTYLSKESVSFVLGDLAKIGFRSSNSPYGFEDLINNVSITSSIYASSNYMKYEIVKDNLKELSSTSENENYTLKIYKECPPWSKGDFLLYENRRNDSLLGAQLIYTGSSDAVNNWIFQKKESFIIYTDKENFMRIKLSAYVNTRENPFESKEIEDDESTRVMEIFCNLILKDENGVPVMYYDNTYYGDIRWKKIEDGIVPDHKFVLGFVFLNTSFASSRVANVWLVNNDIIKLYYGSIAVSRDNVNNGAQIKLPPMSGWIELKTNYAIISNNEYEKGLKVYPSDKVKSILLNNLEINLEDASGEALNTDDYEFKSYINKNVVSDYGDVTLKCISANEAKIPTGKGNILYKKDNLYGLQLAFSRSGQTNILERLLLCTIHSNYTRKNRIFTVDIKTTDNPVMRYSTLKSRWPDDKFLTAGCRIDFNRAITNLTVYNFSEDVDKLSEIPYE